MWQELFLNKYNFFHLWLIKKILSEGPIYFIIVELYLILEKIDGSFTFSVML